jgi:FMN reductase
VAGRPRLTVVLGSVTPPGRLRSALEQAVARANDSGVAETTLVDLAEARVAFVDGRPPEQLRDDTAAVVAAIGGADAVVFATPVYRGSFTGALKNLLDHVPVEALEGKAVGIVAMGASDHHFLGADRHLRDVLAFFGAAVAPVAVYLTAADFADGKPCPDAAAQLDGLVTAVAALSAALPLPSGSLRPLPSRQR